MSEAKGFNLDVLSGSELQETQKSETPTIAAWTAPYVCTENGEDVDVLSRIPAFRRIKATPIRDEDSLNKNDTTLAHQNALLCATGTRDGLPRYIPIVGSVFTNITNANGDAITIPTLVAILKASYMYLPGEGIVTAIEVMKRLGFEVPGKGVKASDTWATPSFIVNNSWHTMKDDKTKVIARMAFVLNDKRDGVKYAINCRMEDLRLDKAELDSAFKSGQGHPMAVAYAEAYKALSYGMLVDMSRYVAKTQGTDEPQVNDERSRIRLVRVLCSQVYYGLSPVSKTSTFTGYHAVVRGIQDPVRAGGNWQNNMPSNRVTAELDVQFPVTVGRG